MNIIGTAEHGRLWGEENMFSDGILDHLVAMSIRQQGRRNLNNLFDFPSVAARKPQFAALTSFDIMRQSPIYCSTLRSTFP